MSIYLGILVWFLAVAMMSKSLNVLQEEYVLGRNKLCWNWLFAFIAFLPLIIWAMNRPLNMGDTIVYKQSFEEMPAAISQLSTYADSVTKDKGFYIGSMLIKCIIGDNYRVYFGILALIQGLLVVSLYRKYSTDYISALFVFLTATDYFSYMQNGVRQFMAVTITLIGFGCLLKKQYIRFVIIIFIASTMHQSALLMIPIAFIVQGEAWNKRTILMLIAALFAVAYISRFTAILDNMLADTQYTNVVSDWQSWNDNGTNPIRVAVYCVPTFLSLLGIRYIKNANNPIINISTNMSIVTTGLYIISMFTSGIFIGRLPIYTSMYSMGILMPWLIDAIFEAKSAKLVKLIMITAFTIFYYYQMHFVWGAM